MTIFLAAALFQGCRGHAHDSNDPGTAEGNDTITTTDAYGRPDYDGFTETPGAGNVGVDSANNDAGGYDPNQGGNRGSNTGEMGGDDRGTINP
ncbi:hypothetical protein BH09BAC1_BH09BAC1_24280 [soil metagenome]